MTPPSRQTAFVGTEGHADVAVITVTYNSADDVDDLIASVRREAVDQRLRVILADNASLDATLDAARAHEDVIIVETGGNLGYAGAINAAMDHVGDTDAILVLNPDLQVHAGAIAALRHRMHAERAGIVVPQILDSDGEVTVSLRREPSILNSLGDAAFGGSVRRRPRVFAGTVFDPDAYASARRVEWSTGAALLIDANAARAVGPWDERFFLYSEETDFFRRTREAGYSVWFEPAATANHAQGGSGASVDLERLMAVNRIRYARKHHSRAYAALFRLVVVLHELVRAAAPRHRAVLRTVMKQSSWSALPHATRSVPAR